MIRYKAGVAARDVSEEFFIIMPAPNNGHLKMSCHLRWLKL
jgi:hypothetical protein